MLNVYERLYNKSDYGKATANRCPGVRYLPDYINYIIDPVIDIGCGSGDTVQALRDAGLRADGIDWIKPQKQYLMQRDITQPLTLFGYSTAICIDVLEHLPVAGAVQCVKNMAVCRRAVISVFTKSHIVDGVELHITQQSKSEWLTIIKNEFAQVRIKVIMPQVRYLFFCKN